jgi:hypothetical protein
MDTFAETAIIYYHLPFADQGKKTPIFYLSLRQTNRSFPFLFSVCSKEINVSFFLLVALFLQYCVHRNGFLEHC